MCPGPGPANPALTSVAELGALAKAGKNSAFDSALSAGVSSSAKRGVTSSSMVHK